MFDNIRADLTRFNDNGRFEIRPIIRGLLSQGFQAILVYRFFRWFYLRNIPTQPFRFFCERFIEIATGISIPVTCDIGKGFRIHHFGGIIFHPTAKLGNDCTIYQGVTIGDKGGRGRAANIGNQVLIGAGAKIIGNVNIGNNCQIGANSVVTKNVPDNTIAIGIPCRFLSLNDNQTSLEEI